MSQRRKARIAGYLYLVAVLAAIFGEFFIRGRAGMDVALTAVPCYVAVTVLTYAIFKAANGRLSFLALSFNLLGLAFEALRLNPGGVDIALVFHGVYCLLIASLIFHATILPPNLWIPMALAGFGWMTFLSPRLADHLSPYNLAVGILGEASLMLWFLAFGVRELDSTTTLGESSREC
jgi:hypothetical protein